MSASSSLCSQSHWAEIVEPLELDPISVADDAHFLECIGEQRNLPPFVKEGLRALYNG